MGRGCYAICGLDERMMENGGRTLLRCSTRRITATLQAGLALLFCFVAQNPLLAQGLTDTDRARHAELVRRRAEWLQQRLTYPLGFVPPNARLKAVQETDSLAVAGSGSQWTLIGPQPIGGNTPFSGTTPSPAVDPPYPDIPYLRAGSGDVLDTTDGAAKWTP